MGGVAVLGLATHGGEVMFELTGRQANRMMGHALRSHALLRLELRTLEAGEVLHGAMAGEEGDLLHVDLPTSTPHTPLHLMLGAYCDAQVTLHGTLYMFTTSIQDVLSTPDTRLVMAKPTSVFAANRRRHERRQLERFAQVRLWPASSATPYIGELLNVSTEGVACRMIRGELDELLLVGDEARVHFELPGCDEDFEAPVLICNKSGTADGTQMTVGLEFNLLRAGPETHAIIDRLRTALCHLTFQDLETDGESI